MVKLLSASSNNTMTCHMLLQVADTQFLRLFCTAYRMTDNHVESKMKNIHTYIYEIYNALIVEDGSNQRRGLLLGGGV